MRYLFEAVLVGIYSVIIYLFISYIIPSYTLSLVIVGFIKHYLGYYFGIHTIYCKYGEKCLQIHENNSNYISNNNFIYVYSLLDGLLYILIGTILSTLFFWIRNYKIKYIIILFLLGFIVHILSEKYFIHNIFCSTNCKKYNYI